MLNEEDVEVLETRYAKAIEAYSQRDSVDETDAEAMTQYEACLLMFLVFAKKAVLDLKRYIGDLETGKITDCDIDHELFEAEYDLTIWSVRYDEVSQYLATT